MTAVFQLEDDGVAKADYYSEMKTFTTQEANEKWLYLELFQLGSTWIMFFTAAI